LYTSFINKSEKYTCDAGLDYRVGSPDEIREEFDLAMDCSGSAPAMEKAVSLLGSGGRLCIFGVANPNEKLMIEPFQV